jgi:hypothetical protein
MASEDKPKKPKKPRDVLINISTYLNMDGEQLNGELSRFATIFQGAVAAAVLNNICKYCGASMTKAANIYIKRNVIPKIVRHPNLDFRKNKNLRGALGVPLRYNYKKVEKYLLRVLVLEVTACGKNVDLFKYLKKQSRSDAGARKTNNQLIKSGKAFEKNKDVYLTNNLDKFAEKAYRETSFRTGGQRNIGRRDWLREADLGETDVSGYDVYELREEDKSAETHYSRSGTHIMIDSTHSYDPNEWRPNPGETHIIRKKFLEMIPDIVDRVRKTIPTCLRRLKAKVKAEVVANAEAATPKAKKKNITSSKIVDNASGIDAAKGVKASNSDLDQGSNTSDINAILATAEINFDAALVRAAGFTDKPLAVITQIVGQLSTSPRYDNSKLKVLESLLRLSAKVSTKG